MPVNGSRGACPCSGSSGSQRAAAGGLLAVGKFSFCRVPAEGLQPVLSSRWPLRRTGHRPPNLLLQFSRNRSAAGSCACFLSQRCCRQEKYPGERFFLHDQKYFGKF